MALNDWTQYNLGSPTVEIVNSSGPLDWFAPGWAFRRTITVDDVDVPSTQTDFPLLVSVAVDAAQSGGEDILFTASDGETKLDHEIESYTVDSFGNGTVLAWVRIPSLSDSVDTIIYVYYDNPLSPTQENPTGVWDSDYIGVWHLSEDPADSVATIFDSTSNDVDGTPQGSMLSADQVLGQIDGSLNFDQVDDYIDLGVVSTLPDSALTVSAWVKPDNVATHPMIMVDSVGFQLESWGLQILSGTIALTVYGTGGTSTSTTGVSADVGTWQHIVGTYDTARKKVFKDGSNIQDVAATISTIDYDAKVLQFGKLVGITTTLGGGLDEVRISKTIRSDDWVSIEYNNQVDPESFHTIGGIESFPGPMVGIGSLVQRGVTSFISMVEENYTLGLTRGKIRDLIRPDKWEGSGVYDAGLFFMASQEDLTTAGACYTYSINSDSDEASTRVELQYHSAGIEETPLTLFAGPTFNRKPGAIPLIIALEVEWVYEPTIIDGILIILREGHSLGIVNFSNLVEVTRLIIFEPDPVFLGVSAAEGIYMDSRGAGGDLTVTRDRTRITRLIPN
jgi:hypothetical protein